MTRLEWLCVGFFTAVVVLNMAIGLSIIIGGRWQHKRAMIALKGIGDTHMLGFEALTIEQNQLKDRLDLVERKLGLTAGSRVDNSIHNR